MKICVITGTYALSGVPLAQMRLSRALGGLGHEVDFAIGMINPGNTTPTLENASTTVFGKARVAAMILPLVRYFRQQKPDVVFSAGDHLNAIVLIAAVIARSKAKISCSSRVTPFDTYSSVFLSKGWILKCVMRAVMGRADAMTCVSEDMVIQYRQIFANAPHRCIYNIVVDERSTDRMMEAVDEPWLLDGAGPILVCAGSLEPWKGFGDLIRAMALVPAELGARLLVLGDGSLRSELHALVYQLGLQDRVKFVGYVENPLKYFRHSDVFVLSSHVEGLPNVLVEAMMCGCTPVATDCPTGPREVLQEGKAGYLVPVSDAQAMASAIVEAISTPVPARILKDAIAEFTVDKVLDKHFEMLGIHGQHTGGA
jgi:glycosyltransferase involved in cell wall biosynthesis